MEPTELNIYWITFLFFMAIPGCLLIAQSLTDNKELEAELEELQTTINSCFDELSE